MSPTLRVSIGSLSEVAGSRDASAPGPTLSLERGLLREGHDNVVGIDEVGRGALAGPVYVGAVMYDAACGPCPPGVRDSKLMTAGAREAAVPVIKKWSAAWSIGSASAREIDDLGIVSALGLAGRRALDGLGRPPCVIILDGSHDWLSRTDLVGPRVVTSVKADQRCATVAAASVVAKVNRDDLMCSLAQQHPPYGWSSNKGYGVPSHIEALRRHGACEQHRRSWALPGLVPRDPSD
jgi:ribonuclease HII